MKKRNIEEEIQTLDALIRDNDLIPSKLRNSVLKQVEIVRKCAKPRRSNKGRNQNQNSGLLKPVLISEEMARFANWGKDELHSRVDVTKVICVYVKNNKLQKPSNKKTILPDKLLQEILRWDADAEEMTVSVLSGADNGNVTVKVANPPSSGLKKASYYNNAELRKSDGEEIAVIKKVDLIDDGNYVFTFNKDVTLAAGDEFIVHVPLTYPKVQTKISVHLTKPEQPEEDKKEKKEKKEKEKEAKPSKKEKKSKKPKEQSSDEE